MNDKDLSLQTILNEIFEDEIYDILDEIPQDALSKKVLYAARQFERGSRTVLFTLKGYFFKIANCMNGFVSCSNAEGTGVSRTLHKPYPKDETDKKEQLENLVSMINESWYLLSFS